MITLRSVRFDETTIPLRRAFGFGITRLATLTHLKATAIFEIDGGRFTGIAGENIVPRWFVKDPSISLNDDIQQLRLAIHGTADRAIGHTAATPFEFWWALYQREAGARPVQPGLVTQLATSIIERAMLDAWCAARSCTFARAANENLLGIRGEQVHQSLAGVMPADVLPRSPETHLHVRHTVGLADAVTELPDELDRTGIRRLKLKLSGDPATDAARLIEVGDTCTGRVDRVTLDGNENYPSVTRLDEFLSLLFGNPAARSIAAGIAWVEQPLHRDAALSDDVRELSLKWPDIRFVLDESDASPVDLPRALSLGYAGTTHKNCKGVFKSILAAMLLNQHASATGRAAIFSGEDLTIVAPWSQAQDLAVAAAVGVVDVERNGQHFADGLSAFPSADQDEAIAQYGPLYRRTDLGVELAIEAGRIDISACSAHAFGRRQ